MGGSFFHRTLVRGCPNSILEAHCWTLQSSDPASRCRIGHP